MTSFRSRPRFKHVSKTDLINLKNRIEIKLKDKSDSVSGFVEESFCTFKIKEKEQHFWSPHLNVNFEETEEGTILRGRYGPHPSIWTLFAFAYSALGLSFTAISLYGLTKYSLHLESGILWLLPAISIGIIILYILAQTGQKLGVDQTYKIHQFFEECIKEKIDIH